MGGVVQGTDAALMSHNNKPGKYHRVLSGLQRWRLPVRAHLCARWFLVSSRMHTLTVACTFPLLCLVFARAQICRWHQGVCISAGQPQRHLWTTPSTAAPVTLACPSTSTQRVLALCGQRSHHGGNECRWGVWSGRQRPKHQPAAAAVQLWCSYRGCAHALLIHFHSRPVHRRCQQQHVGRHKQHWLQPEGCERGCDRWQCRVGVAATQELACTCPVHQRADH